MNRDKTILNMEIFFERNGFPLNKDVLNFLVDHSAELDKLTVEEDKNMISFHETFCDNNPKCIFTAYEYLRYMYEYACADYMEDVTCSDDVEDKNIKSCIKDIEQFL